MSDRVEAALTGTDRQWWNATGNCGGCGMDNCHPGIGCTAGDDGCRYCPDRGGGLTPPKPKQEIPVLEGQTSIEDVIGEFTDCESCGHAYTDHAEESCEIAERWCQCPGYWGKAVS